MAGVTTASRAGWGVIASSEDMNPKLGGDYWDNATSASNNYAIYGIPATEWRDLEIYFSVSNQSSWTSSWYFWFNNQSSMANSAYMYKGYSTGYSYGYNSQTSSYQYPCGYSNYAHCGRLYISNYSSDTNNKSFWGQWGNTNGTATSYVTSQCSSGVLNTSSPISSFHIQSQYGNGNSSYQWWLICGRGVKE